MAKANKLKRRKMSRAHGFLKRKSSSGGKKVVRSRRRKGRRALTK